MRIAAEIVLSEEERSEMTKLARSKLTSVRLAQRPQTHCCHQLNEYVAHHNTKPKPFIWTKNARGILQKVVRANLA